MGLSWHWGFRGSPMVNSWDLSGGSMVVSPTLTLGSSSPKICARC